MAVACYSDGRWGPLKAEQGSWCRSFSARPPQFTVAVGEWGSWGFASPGAVEWTILPCESRIWDPVKLARSLWPGVPRSSAPGRGWGWGLPCGPQVQELMKQDKHFLAFTWHRSGHSQHVKSAVSWSSHFEKPVANVWRYGQAATSCQIGLSCWQLESLRLDPCGREQLAAGTQEARVRLRSPLNWYNMPENVLR